MGGHLAQMHPRRGGGDKGGEAGEVGGTVAARPDLFGGGDLAGGQGLANRLLHLGGVALGQQTVTLGHQGIALSAHPVVLGDGDVALRIRIGGEAGMGGGEQLGQAGGFRQGQGGAHGGCLRATQAIEEPLQVALNFFRRRGEGEVQHVAEPFDDFVHGNSW